MSTYWEQLIEEVLNKGVKRKVHLSNIVKNPAEPKVYNNLSWLTVIVHSKTVHLSKRECECVWYALHGETMRSTAEELRLSVRTIEYYLNNVKKKTSCQTKSDLIALFLNSNFTELFEGKL